MGGINGGPLGKRRVEKGFGQMLRLDRGLKFGNTAQRREPLCRLSAVALCCFLQNRFGNEAGKKRAP